jgi:predicted nucleic acid-binding protein
MRDPRACGPCGQHRAYLLQCVTHVLAHLLRMSPVHTQDTRAGEDDLLDRLLAAQRPLMCDLISVEILQGFCSDLDLHRARRALDVLQCVAIGGRAVTIAAAQSFRALKRRGVAVRKTIDALISTFCIIHGHELLHCDRDFEPFERHPGLRVIKA